jgi:Zn-dependent metalloprotease
VAEEAELRKLLIACAIICLGVVAAAAQTQPAAPPCCCAQPAPEAAAAEPNRASLLMKPVTGILPGATVQHDSLTGYVRRAKGRVSMPRAHSAREAAHEFLKRFRGLFGPEAGAEEFRQTNEIATAVGNKITFKRFIDGLPVLEDEITIVVDKSHAVTLVNSDLHPLRQVSSADATKSLDGEAASAVAVKCVVKSAGVKDPDVSPASEQGYFVTKDGRAVLVWRITFDTREPLASWEVLVEAASGRVFSVDNIAAYKK